MARMIETLTLSMNRIFEWANSIGITFSPGKTKFIIFSRKRNQIHPSINFNNNVINPVIEIKFLGLLWDSKLTWLPYITQLKTKCMLSMNLLRTLTHTKWSADRKSVIKVYKSVIRSKTEYGCVVYNSARDSVIEKLNVI